MAQTPTPPTKVNFGYSQNPKTKAKKESTETTATVNPPKINISTVSDTSAENTEEKSNQNSIIPVNNNPENRSIAQKTLDIAKKASTVAAMPTEIYKVGTGDVLFINIQNAPAKTANYFTVLTDGTIDYPLAGAAVSVVGMTTDDIEELLAEKIKLYENPQVSVKMREYSSHVINVLGLVEKAGEKYLQREAIPLYVIRAEAVVQSKANGITIKRANSTTEKIDMKDPKYEEILVFPGDIVEFTSTTEADSTTASQSSRFYYIGGNIISMGQKEFYSGITLTQAILVSGGLKKASTKKVIIRRKNNENLLTTTEFNLKDIKDGKAPDPVLQAGDTIEIGNN